jgi:hypothetical protein
VVLSLRDLWGNTGQARGGGFPSEHPILLSVFWIVGILVVFLPFAVSRYRRAAAR